MGIKNLFFNSGEDDDEVIDEVVEEIVEEVEPIKEEAPTTVTATVGAGTVQNDIADQIAAILEKENLDGCDYFEFAKMLQSSKESIPVESARYTAMFAAGVPMGLTVKVLIDSANHYLKVLDNVESQSQSAIDEKTDVEVTALTTKAEKYSTAIEEKNIEIKQLTEEINTLYTEKTELLNEAETNKGTIQTTVNNFNTTIKVFRDRIIGDLERVDKYLNKES